MKVPGLITVGKLIRWHVTKRPPDVLIGGDGTRDGCYMQRHWVIPRNKHFNIYLHKFQHDDEDRALHDHPWWSISCLIEGKYFEHVAKIRAGDVHKARMMGIGDWRIERHAGDVAIRGATAAHRISLPRGYGAPWYEKPIPCWTIFITGPKRRVWGFHCPKGWVDHETFGEGGTTFDAEGRGISFDSRKMRGCGED